MKYRKKPVVIEAIQWDGINLQQIKNFIGDSFLSYQAERHIGGRQEIVIRTLEGQHVASRGDYVIRGVQGEFYPCKPEIFDSTYELVGIVTGKRISNEVFYLL